MMILAAAIVRSAPFEEDFYSQNGINNDQMNVVNENSVGTSKYPLEAIAEDMSGEEDLCTPGIQRRGIHQQQSCTSPTEQGKAPIGDIRIDDSRSRYLEDVKIKLSPDPQCSKFQDDKRFYYVTCGGPEVYLTENSIDESLFVAHCVNGT